jgi:dTMP kinase
VVAVNPGSFLVLEGIDGCGKSTQAARLVAALRAAGHEVVATSEPYAGGTWGPRIRAMARSGEPLPAAEELAWFVAQRREHVAEVVAPALSAGRVVVSDRYYLSTVAYQGARGLDAETILRESEAEFPTPDLALVLEIKVAAGLGRLPGRDGPAEPVFEQRERLDRAAAIFATLERPWIAHVDARGTPDAVHARVRAVVAERLGLLDGRGAAGGRRAGDVPA